VDERLRDLLSQRESIGKLQHFVARDWRAVLDERMKPMGMSDARWTVLFGMQVLGKPSPQHQIAELLGVTGPTLFRMLDKLERDGLVRRVTSEDDRRVKLVELLPAGSELLEPLLDMVSTLENELLSVFSDEERKLLWRLLQRLFNRLGELSGQGRGGQTG